MNSKTAQRGLRVLPGHLKDLYDYCFFWLFIRNASVFMFIANLPIKSSKMIIFFQEIWETIETLKLCISVSFPYDSSLCLPHLNVLHLINSLWLHCVSWFFLLCLFWTIWTLFYLVLGFGLFLFLFLFSFWTLVQSVLLQLLVPSTTG